MSITVTPLPIYTVPDLTAGFGVGAGVELGTSNMAGLVPLEEAIGVDLYSQEPAIQGVVLKALENMGTARRFSSSTPLNEGVWALPPDRGRPLPDPSIPPVPMRLAAGASQAIGLSTGMRMSLELNQRLELSQSMRLELTLTQALQSSNADYYAGLYANAKKLRIRLESLGLDFEVALVSRLDLPEMMHLGSAGLMAYGFPFVMEDFFVDLGQEERDRFIQLVAVHEYGEVIFGNHHMASLLELAVAKHWGVLEGYLEFLESRYAAKFRDVALHRLRGPLLQGLKEENFDIPEEDLAAESEWFPPSGEEAQVLAARRVLEQYPVSDAVAERFEAAVRDDMKISEGELNEWVQYITALEQTRAFYAKALQDAAEAKDALTLRLAVFRVLGVMAYEDEEGILGTALLEPELEEKLITQFWTDFKNRVTESQPSLAADPLWEAEPGYLYELACMDASIWRNLKLELKLLEWGDERKKIEKFRRRAWGYALKTARSMAGQEEAFRSYSKTIDWYEKLETELEGTIQQFKTRTRKKTPRGFLDRTDYEIAIREELLSEIFGNETFEKAGGPAWGMIEEILADREVFLPEVHRTRLAYLAEFWREAEAKTKRKIERVLRSLNLKWEKIAERHQVGELPAELALVLAEDALQKGRAYFTTDFQVPVETLPYQLASSDGDFAEVLASYRGLFCRRVAQTGKIDPPLFKQALKQTSDFWQFFHGCFVRDAKPVFELAAAYVEVLPQLNQALAGLTPEALWQKLNLRSVLDWQEEGPETKVDLFSPGGLPLDVYLQSYSASDAPKNPEKLLGWGKAKVLQTLFDPLLRLHNRRYDQIQLDLYAEWIRRSAAPEAPAGYFRIDKAALDTFWDATKERLQSMGIGTFGDFEELLADVAQSGLDVGDLGKLFETLNEKEGYDRYGTLGTRVKNFLRRRLERIEGVVAEDAPEAKAWFDHFATILDHYEGLEDLSAEKIGEELRDIFEEDRNIGDGSQGENVLRLCALYALRAIQQGQLFLNMHEVRQFLSDEFDADRAMLREKHLDDYLPTHNGALWKSFTLKALGNDSYDRVGFLEEEARRELMEQILRERRGAPAVLNGSEHANLRDHWRDVIEKLTHFSNELDMAERLLLDVFKDVAAFRTKTMKDGISPPFDDRLWETRQAWVLLHIRAGKTFKDGADILARMPKALLPSGKRHAGSRETLGFLSHLLRSTGNSASEQRQRYAQEIAAHLRQQKRAK